jgi:hypothetical protein
MMSSLATLGSVMAGSPERIGGISMKTIQPGEIDPPEFFSATVTIFAEESIEDGVGMSRRA